MDISYRQEGEYLLPNLTLDSQPEGEIDPENCDISISDLCFSYDEDREVLHNVSFDIPKGKLTSVCGESGSGKSTVSAILMGRNKGYKGSVTIGGKELSSISEKSLMQTLTYISHNAYLFGGTVRDFLWKDRISFVLWPIWMESDVNDLHTTDILWPIYSRGLSDDGKWDKLRVFPFYSRIENKRQFVKKSVMWPFWNQAEYTHPKANGKAWVLFPVPDDAVNR